jgi:thiamine-phosphate pyrophosphorylase
VGRAERLQQLRGLYGIVDDGLELAPLPWARALAGGGASVIQLRFKQTPMGEALAQARRIRRELPGILLLINDRVDLALLCEADGVHLGEHDLAIAEARRQLGAERLIGATARNLAEGAARLDEGADHLGAGPVFASATKPMAIPLLGLEGLRRICQALPGTPVVAISGIDEENIGSVASSGARAAAVIGAVGRAADPLGTAKRLSQRFALGALAQNALAQNALKDRPQ